MGKIITRRGLLRAAGIAAPAIILPERVWAQFNGCPPGFCSPPVGGGSPTNPCGFAYPPLSNIIGWWDLSCATTITLGSPSGPNFALVSVADSTGNGNIMTKFNASYPLYRATQFNTSYPGALFTSTDLGCMYCPTFPMGTGNTMTAWYVGTMAGSTSGGFGRTLSYNVAGGFEMMATGSTTTVKCYRGTFPTGLVSSAASVYPAGHRFIYTIKSNGDLTIYIDNVATGGLTISGNFTNNGTLLFGGEAGASGGGFWTGIASEWGISADYSDATAAAALDLYLKNKWGL